MERRLEIINNRNGNGNNKKYITNNRNKNLRNDNELFSPLVNHTSS